MAFGRSGDGSRRWRREAPGLTMVRLGLMTAGLILWGYGAHADVDWLRLLGIGVFIVVVALRFWPGGSREPHDPDSNEPRE